MAQFETWLKSDLSSPPIIQTIKGNVFSSDNQGNLVGVEVYHDGEPVALVGTVSGYIIRDDGATVIVSGTVSGNKASIIMPEAAYVCPGPIGIAIRLTNGTSRVVLGACRSIVYRTSTEHIVDPSHEIPDIDELLAQLVAIRAATSAANTATANANAAAGNATTAAGSANNAAGNANEKATLANAAAGTANAAAAKIDGMTVAASLLPTGSAPTATVSEVSGHKHIAFGIPKGDKGKDFHIAHTFASIAAMEAYSGPLELFDYAMIDTGSVQDADTGKLYCYEADEQWHYIGDLSGAQGIKGETGTGIDHITLNADYTLTIYYDNSTSYTTGSIRGATGATPNIQIGTVSTLNPDQSATATMTGTPEQPILNLGIPRGQTGSVTNVYGTTIPVSESDNRNIKQVLDTIPTVDSALNNNSQNPVENRVIHSAVKAINDKIGNTALPTTAQTLTGAIDEHEQDFISLNNNSVGVVELSATTLADLKNSLLSVASTCSSAGRSRCGIQFAIDDSYYTDLGLTHGYETFQGLFEYVSTYGSGYFFANLTGNNGQMLTINYMNGTWAFNSLTDNIAKLRQGLSYVEDGTTIAANAAYTAGKFICWQGEMYRIKATINATVTSGNWTTYLDKMDGMGGALSQINADLTSLNDRFTPVTFKLTNSTVQAITNEYVDTGLSITIPAESIYSIEGRLFYSNSVPTRVILSTNQTVAYPWDNRLSAEEGCPIIYLSGYTNTELTLYMFGKWEYEASNGCFLKGWYKTLS